MCKIRKLFIFLTSATLLFTTGCASIQKVTEDYNDAMIQSEALATIVANHAQFSACFWVEALGSDADRTLPAEAKEVLNKIYTAAKDTLPEEMTDCQKAEILGLWTRFTYLVSAEVIRKIIPAMAQFIGTL